MPISTGLNPAYGQQWHISKIFRGFQDRIWAEFKGAGIKVGVFDDGIEKTHADLRGNYNAAGELRINGVVADPSLGSGVHGTAVAGIIAAQADNGIGGVGVAHGASITGFNVFSGLGAGSNFLLSIRAMSTMDVANNSWGWTNRYADGAAVPGSFGQQFQAALKFSVDTGRAGLGTVIVNAAGNDGQALTDANASQFNASRYTITVGAIGQDGDVAAYSTRGSSVFISAPSSGGGQGITTTDRSGGAGYSATDVTNVFGGTSAAAPIVSAVAALMLDANERLGWRDVQDILSITADHTTPSGLVGPATGRMTSGWTINRADNVNGGGMHYSNDVGFGQVDGFEAVRFAEVWSRFGAPQTSVNEQTISVSGSLNRLILDNQTTEFRVNVARAIDIESAAVTLTLTHGNLNDLRVELVSPEGTRSVVLAPSTGVNAASNLTWTFTTEALRGETSLGNWTVRVTDTRTGAAGSVASYRLDIYGDAPSANDVYHYTNEFARMASLDAGRAVLRDVDGGVDWINASATTDDARVNLNQAATSSLYGRTLTIAAGTVIENAVTGDGNDVLIGNDAANILLGMRGNDTLDGGAGADQLEGGAGIDTASYLRSTAAVDVNLMRATQIGGDAQGDVLLGIENVVGSNFNDVITGDAGANRLEGGAGNDVINAGGGNDMLLGGVGNDTLNGGAGADVINGGDGVDAASYANSAASVTVDLIRLVGIGGDAQGDSYISIENAIGSGFNDILVGDAAANLLDGGAGNDILRGGGGNDILIGGLGNDILIGGLGNDVLTGGQGNDIFAFDAGGFGADTLTDFQDGRDLLDLRGLGLTFASIAITASADRYIVSAGGSVINVCGAERGILTASDFIFI